MKKFIKLLKRMRENAGMSQNQLARISGLTPPHINKIEMGKYDTITVDTLLKLGRAFEPEHRNPNMPRATQVFFECFMEE